MYRKMRTKTQSVYSDEFSENRIITVLIKQVQCNAKKAESLGLVTLPLG